MFHVGLDIHSRRISICVLGETGQVARRAQVTVHGLYFDGSHPVASAPSFALSVRSDGYAA